MCYELTLNMTFFVTLFSATIFSRIMKLYRHLPHIMLQRVSHFRGHAISTSCLQNTLIIYALTLNMNFFVAPFLNNYKQYDLETLQEASTHHTVACKPFSWSCHIHFLFAEYFNILHIDVVYDIFRRTFLRNYIFSRIMKLYRKLPKIILQRRKPFSGLYHIYFLFAEYFKHFKQWPKWGVSFSEHCSQFFQLYPHLKSGRYIVIGVSVRPSFRPSFRPLHKFPSHSSQQLYTVGP